MAAYFAVTEDNEQDGAVWVVNVASVVAKMQERYGDKPLPKKQTGINDEFLIKEAQQVLHFFERKTRTERMIAQQGIFSVSHNVLSNHGEILHATLKSDSTKLEFSKLIIPAELKGQFTKGLRSMNLTASSLFPGLDGLGKSIREFINLA